MNFWLFSWPECRSRSCGSENRRKGPEANRWAKHQAIEHHQHLGMGSPTTSPPEKLQRIAVPVSMALIAILEKLSL